MKYTFNDAYLRLSSFKSLKNPARLVLRGIIIILSVFAGTLKRTLTLHGQPKPIITLHYVKRSNKHSLMNIFLGQVKKA